MKVTVQELAPRFARMTVEETAPWFVNSLRRVLISEVPKLAIGNVVVYDNNSALFDEIISQRVGLLPIPTDLAVLNFRDQCVCEGQGCANCTVRFTLSKEGPATVYSGDLQPEDAKYAPADERIPIVELLKGQRLILEAEATLGRGREHARWQPATGAGYSYFASVKGGAKTEEAVKSVAKSCPIDSPKVKGKYSVVDKSGNLSLCDSCIGGLEEQDIQVDWDDSRFDFKFETDGSLSAKDALIKALEIMQGRTAEMEELAGKLKVVAANA